MIVNLLQLSYVLGGMLSLPLMPLVYWQGKKVREVVPKLPEPPDAKTGLVEGNGKPLNIVTMGESTTVSLGLDTHLDGLAAQVSNNISELTGQACRWSIIGKSGLTASQVKEQLVPQLPTDVNVDLILIALGGNDTFKLNSPRKWNTDCIRLIEAIRRRQPNCPIVFTNMPPISQFPAFPAVMAKFLGGLGMLLGKAIEDLPSRYHNVYYNSQPIKLEEWVELIPPGGTYLDFFSDGIHPSALTFKIWGKGLAEFVVAREVILR